MHILIAIGQCGIQISNALPNLESTKVITIDSEFKTNADIKLGVCGRGNNWAAGHAQPDILNTLSRSIECQSMHHSIFLLHSTSGGTGSGLGSLLAKEIRSKYPMKHVISFLYVFSLFDSVTAFETGDTALQHYNSLLATFYSLQFTDTTVLIHNDSFKRKTLEDMNISIAKCLCSLLRSFNPSAFTSIVAPLGYFTICTLKTGKDLSECWPHEKLMFTYAIVDFRDTSRNIADFVVQADQDFAVLFYTGPSIRDWILRLIGKVEKCATSGAYLHHYERFDSDIGAVFEEACEEMKKIVDVYNDF